MKNKISIGIVSIIFVLFIVLSVSAINAESSSGNDTMLSTSKDGIVINYPSDWGYSKASSNTSIMAFSKLDSIDSSGIGQVNINIEKKSLGGSDFKTFVDKMYKSLQKDTSFKLISSGDVMVQDIQGLEYVYTSNELGGQRQHKAVWFEKNNQAYVLLYSAPADQFESNLYIFEYIIENMEIT